jgi:hypothetical protein
MASNVDELYNGLEEGKLIVAIANNEYEVVKKSLQAGVNVNKKKRSRSNSALLGQLRWKFRLHINIIGQGS